VPAPIFPVTREWYWTYRDWSLLMNFSNQIDKWWDADRWHWVEGPERLPMYCHDNFDVWWDTDRFCWKYGSWSLAKYCHDNFDEWWDADKFNWDDYGYLDAICSAKFTNLQLKQLLLHSNKIARNFAKKEFNRRNL